MPDTDRILRILLQVKAEVDDLVKVSGTLSQVRTETEKTAKSGFGLRQAFEFAGAEEALRRTLDFIKEVGRGFEDQIQKGVDFNSELQQIQISFAAILQQTQGGRFGDFAQAKNAASDYIDTIKAKANELGIGYRDMLDAVAHTQAQLANAGVHDINQAIELAAILNRAMQSVGVEGTRAARDIGDILQGRASQTLAGPRLAGLLGMTKEDFDLWLQQALQSGRLYDELKTKFGSMTGAIKEGSTTFQADVNRMQNALLDLQSTASEPIMQPLQQGIERLTELMKSDDAKAWAATTGGAIVEVTKDIAAGAQELIKYRDLLRSIPGVGAALNIGGFLGSGAQQAQQAEKIQQQTDTLQKQTNALDQQVRIEQDKNKQGLLWLDVISQQATVQQAIAAEESKGNAADQGILSQLLGMNDQLAQIRIKWNEIVGSITVAGGAIGQVTAEQRKFLDQLDLYHAMTYGDDAEVYRAKWTQTYNSIAEEAKKVGKSLTQNELDQLTYERLRGPERQREIQQLENVDQLQKDITAFLREESAEIAHIHNLQQLINSNPFMGVNEKSQALAGTMVAEISELNSQIAKGDALMQGGALDPAKYAQVSKAVDELRTRVQLLQFQLKETSFTGGLVADLTKWANSFGTVSQQISHTIQGTINASLQQFNQLILTGKFNTQQLLQQIVQLGLTLVEQLIIQRAMMAINSAYAAGQATTTASVVSAAWATPATLVSIATEGEADAQAPIAVASALAAVQGMAFLAEGGLVTRPTLAMVGEAGPELVVPLRNIGSDHLEAAHNAARSMSGGETVTSSTSPSRGRGGDQHFAFFVNKKDALGWLKDRDGRKTLVDVLRGERIHVGM